MGDGLRVGVWVGRSVAVGAKVAVWVWAAAAVCATIVLIAPGRWVGSGVGIKGVLQPVSQSAISRNPSMLVSLGLTFRSGVGLILDKIGSLSSGRNRRCIFLVDAHRLFSLA